MMSDETETELDAAEVKELTEDALDGVDNDRSEVGYRTRTRVKDGEVRVEAQNSSLYADASVSRSDRAALDDAGIQWRFKEDRRFRDDKDHSVVIITGVEDSEDGDGEDEPEVRTDGGVDVDVEQYAGDEVRVMTHIVGKMSSPSVLTGEVSGSGKTISVEDPHFSDSYRLDTATIMGGESEYRDSLCIQLYTRERFQRVQKANHAPGPQSGANGVSEDADLPDATHFPPGEEPEDMDEDTDEDPDGGEDTPSADDEGLIAYYRERWTDATVEELQDAREDLTRYLRDARDSGQTGNVPELRAKVRAVARELSEREPEGASDDEVREAVKRVEDSEDASEGGEDSDEGHGTFVVADGGEGGADGGKWRVYERNTHKREVWYPPEGQRGDALDYYVMGGASTHLIPGEPYRADMETVWGPEDDPEDRPRTDALCTAVSVDVAHRASLHHVRTVLDEDGLDAPTEALNLCGNCSRALERRLSSGEDVPEVMTTGVPGTPDAGEDERVVTLTADREGGLTFREFRVDFDDDLLARTRYVSSSLQELMDGRRMNTGQNRPLCHVVVDLRERTVLKVYASDVYLKSSVAHEDVVAAVRGVNAVHASSEPEDTATDGGEYEPERATLRDGEQPDMDAHARRNAAQIALADREDGGDA
jgi:hypothetical protein